MIVKTTVGYTDQGDSDGDDESDADVESGDEGVGPGDVVWALYGLLVFRHRKRLSARE